MDTMKLIRAAAVAVAVLGFGLAGTEAHAGKNSCDSGYSHHDRSHYKPTHYKRSHYSSHYHRGHTSHRDTSHHDNSHTSSYPSRYSNDSFRLSVSYSSSNRGYTSTHYSRQHTPQVRHSTYSFSHGSSYHTSHAPSGYWSRAYVAPTYEWRRASCGTAYRVCVRAGYYERVWVSTGSGHRY